MKKIISIAGMFVLLFVSQLSFGQDINEIVNNHNKAIGGVENWNKVKNIRCEAVLKAQGAEVKMSMNMVDKKAMRLDISVMGMSGYQILTDKAGWSFMPFQGQTKPEPMTPEDVKASQDDLYIIDEFITYKDLGKKIELLGTEDIEGTECHKISLTDKEGKVTTFYVDASNHLIVKKSAKRSVNGKEFETNTTYNNYKPANGGILLPMNQGGDMGEIEFTKMEVNANIDEKIFTPETAK
ncbi:MAG: hypothetical protein IPI46_02165 [Bacteroidetes bacterium]|nr:hypothetical protein [Bacteroidota bacterium]